MKDSFFCSLVIFVCFLSMDVLAKEVLAQSDVGQHEFSAVYPGGCQKVDATSYLELENGIKVLLISDMASNKVRGLLDVDVGYRDDPEDVPGMAHFLEHMLFQGTINDPENNAYKKFLMAHGGSSNASTAYGNTNYHFEIDPEYFDQALAMFSDQFKTPLFSEEFIDKEKNVLHAEFMYRKDSLYRQQLSVAKETFFKGHPMQKFGVGNDDALSQYDKPTLAKKMREWWQVNYSSKKMSVVLTGPKSTKQLEALAVKHFSNIPVFNGKTEPKTNSGKLKEKVPQIARTVIDDEERAMLLMFPIPNFPKDVNNASARFIESLLEREVPGSFVNNLKGYRYASSIDAEVITLDDTTYLEIYIDLWYKGGEQYWDVLKRLFYYVDKLKSEALEQWRLDEFNHKNALKWCYEDTTSLSLLARNIKITSPEKVFSHQYYAESLAPDIYQKILNSIKVENMFAVIVYPYFDVDKTTPWFEVEYSVEPISESDFKNFQPEKNKNLYMDRPKLNPYLPKEVIHLKDSVREAPVKLKLSKNFNAWYQKDTSFDDARSYFYVQLTTEASDNSKKDAATANLFVEILEEQLKYLESLAADSNNYIGMSKIKGGLELYFEGYPDSIDKLIDEVLVKFKNFNIRKDLFERYRYGWLYYLKKAEEIHPLTQSDSMQKQIIRGDGYSYSEQHAGMKGTRKSYLFNYLNELKENLSVTSLSYGNVTLEQATAWNTKIQDSMIKKKRVYKNLHQARKLPAGVSRVTLETTYDDSVNEVYVQGFNDSAQEKAKFRLLHYLMSEKFFSQLRTEMNAGYVINARALRYSNMPGFNFQIQSPYSSADRLESDILVFLNQYVSILNKMPTAEFEAAKEALINELRNDPDTSNNYVSRIWRSILYEKNHFDHSIEQLNAIEPISKADFTEWYRSRFNSESKRILSVMIMGESHEFSDDWEDQVEDTIIDDFEDFIEDLSERHTR